MWRLRRLAAKLRALAGRGAAERELSREIAAHLELIEEDLRRNGMPPDEARVEARRIWGGVEQTRELHRDERSFVWLEQLLRDLGHTGRSVRRSPGFFAVAVLSLVFGIGVTTAVFT